MKTTKEQTSKQRSARKRALAGDPIDEKIEQETRSIVGREIQRDINLSVNAAIAGVVEHFKVSRQVEDIMAKGMKADPVAYALGSLLVELSNDANVDYTHPRIAGLFYRVAVNEAQKILNPSWSLQTTLRHLAILLENPNATTARKITKFLDEGDVTTKAERDPFPVSLRRRKGGNA